MWNPHVPTSWLNLPQSSSLFASDSNYQPLQLCGCGLLPVSSQVSIAQAVLYHPPAGLCTSNRLTDDVWSLVLCCFSHKRCLLKLALFQHCGVIFFYMISLLSSSPFSLLNHCAWLQYTQERGRHSVHREVLTVFRWVCSEAFYNGMCLRVGTVWKSKDDSASLVWVPGFELSSSGLAASLFIH